MSLDKRDAPVLDAGEATAKHALGQALHVPLRDAARRAARTKGDGAMDDRDRVLHGKGSVPKGRGSRRVAFGEVIVHLYALQPQPQCLPVDRCDHPGGHEREAHEHAGERGGGDRRAAQRQRGVEARARSCFRRLAVQRHVHRQALAGRGEAPTVVERHWMERRDVHRLGGASLERHVRARPASWKHVAMTLAPRRVGRPPRRRPRGAGRPRRSNSRS